jgi:hypothetical protein
VAERGEAVDDVAGDVQASERAELLKRDFVGEGGLNAQRADEDVSEHGAVGERLDGVLVSGEG